MNAPPSSSLIPRDRGDSPRFSRLIDGISRWLWPLLFVVFILTPLGFYFSELMIHPVEPLRALFSPGDELRRLARVLVRTVTIAGLAAALAVLFGVAAFTAIQAAPKSFRVGLAWLAAVPFFIPGHFVAIAWIQTIGRAGWLTRALASDGTWEEFLPSLLYSSHGGAAIMALRLYPVVLALLWMGSRSVGASAIESAVISMPPIRLWRAFIFGWLRPWLAIAAVVVFILCLLDYSIPFLLRQKVFTVEVMTAFNIYYDPPRATALALPLLTVSLAAAAVLGMLFPRASWPVFSRRIGRLPSLPGPILVPVICFAAILGFSSLFVPLSTLIRMAGGWETYRTVAESARSQVGSSLLWSGVTAASVLVLAAGLVSSRLGGLVGHGAGFPRSPRWAVWSRRLMFGVMLALFALPGSIIGMAHLTFWNRPGLGGLLNAVFDSGLLLPLGLVTALLPIGFLIFDARLRETPKVLREVAMLTPVNPARQWWLLTAPRLTRAALGAAALVFVLAMQDVNVTILLAAPGQETLAIRTLTLLHYAPDNLVAALCLVTLAAMTLGLAALWGLDHLARFTLRKATPHCALD